MKARINGVKAQFLIMKMSQNGLEMMMGVRGCCVSAIECHLMGIGMEHDGVKMK